MAMQAFARRNQQQSEEEWRADLNVRLICPDCQDDTPDLAEEMVSRRPHVVLSLC